VELLSSQLRNNHSGFVFVPVDVCNEVDVSVMGTSLLVFPRFAFNIFGLLPLVFLTPLNERIG
jgi:hypothetical protein